MAQTKASHSRAAALEREAVAGGHGEDVAGGVELTQGVVEAADARLDRGRLAFDAHKADAADAQAEQVFGGNVAGAVIIDADQVAGAAAGGFLGAAVQQHYRNARDVNQFHDAHVHPGAGGAEFQGSKKDAGDAARDGLARQFDGLLLFGIAPDGRGSERGRWSAWAQSRA